MGSIPINYPAMLKTLKKLSLNSSVVEHWTENPRVVGSIPALSKNTKRVVYLLGEMVDALDLKFSSFRVSVQVR